MRSFAACVAATYSASVVDRVTSYCLHGAQEMAALSMRKEKSDIAWRRPWEALLVSYGAVALVALGECMSSGVIEIRKTCLTASQCTCPRLLTYMRLSFFQTGHFGVVHGFNVAFLAPAASAHLKQLGDEILILGVRYSVAQ